MIAAMNSNMIAVNKKLINVAISVSIIGPIVIVTTNRTTNAINVSIN